MRGVTPFLRLALRSNSYCHRKNSFCCNCLSMSWPTWFALSRVRCASCSLRHNTSRQGGFQRGTRSTAFSTRLPQVKTNAWRISRPGRVFSSQGYPFDRAHDVEAIIMSSSLGDFEGALIIVDPSDFQYNQQYFRELTRQSGWKLVNAKCKKTNQSVSLR